MDGVTILSETLHSEMIPAIIAGILFLLTSILAGVLSILSFENCNYIFGVFVTLITLFLLLFSGFCIYYGVTDDTINQKVVVNDSVNMDDFLEKYKIIDQDGKILTVEVIDEENNSIKLLFDKVWKAIYNSGFIHCLLLGACLCVYRMYIADHCGINRSYIIIYPNIKYAVVTADADNDIKWGTHRMGGGESYSMCEWISVKDILPQNRERVLAFSPSKYLPEEYCTEIMYYDKKRRAFTIPDTEVGEILDFDVTHWMPLPKAPKEV